jgi:E3 ubiquitin-protein ligase RGLG
MGGISSKRASPRQASSIGSPRQASSIGSNSYSWGHQNHPQSPYAPPSQEYWSPPQHFAPPPQPQTYGGGQAPDSRRRLERKYSKIDDNYITLEQVYCIVYTLFLLLSK